MVDHGINRYHNIILSNNILRRNIHYLFTDIHLDDLV